MNTTTIIILVVLAIVVFYIWSLYNKLATGKVRIKEAFSDIDIQLKRRVDLIPNLIETVKGYAKHERDIFENVTKARSMLMKADSPKDKAASNNMLSDAIKSIFAISENYPTLKASDNFKELQEELSDTEDKIAYARKFYNSIVMDYNTTLVNFPGSVLAGMFGFTQSEFFEATEGERQPVAVKF